MSRLIALAAVLLALPAVAQVPARLRINAERLQFDRVHFDGPIATEDSNRDEYHAYCDTVLHARQFPTEELIRDGDHFVTLRDLLDKKAGRTWQFELLTMNLNIKKCRPFPAPKPLVAQGVPTLYECWLFVPPSDNAVCLIASELPPGVEPDLNYPYAKPVMVAGYFFKLLHYESQERDPERPGKFLTRRAPLLIGHSFAMTEPAVAPPGPWDGPLLPAVVGMLLFLGVAAIGFVWYFRGGDKGVRAELAARRDRNPFAPPSLDSSPPSDL